MTAAYSVAIGDFFASILPREPDLRLSCSLCFFSSVIPLVLALIPSNDITVGEIASESWPYSLGPILAVSLMWGSLGLLLIHFIRCTGYKTPLVAHWRSIPLAVYVITACTLLTVDLFDVQYSSTASSIFTLVSGYLILALVGIAVSLSTLILIIILPLPLNPRLRGKYIRIGTHSFLLPKTEGLVVQCWFPISTKIKITFSSVLRYIFLFERKRSLVWTSGNPARENKELRKLLDGISKVEKESLSLWNHLFLARSRSEYCEEIYVLAEKDIDTYPVAIYSHDIKGWRQDHYRVCEQLAANGFMVFALDHAPDAMVSRSVDAAVSGVGFDFSYGDEDSSLSSHETTPAYRDFYRKGVERRALDIKTLLDYLQTVPPLVGRLELKRAQIWGHGYGAAAAATVASLDERIRGVALWDGWLFPMPDEVRALGTKASILALSSEYWKDSKYQAPFIQDFLKNSPNGFEGSHGFRGLHAVIRGTHHTDFNDLAHAPNLRFMKYPSGRRGDGTSSPDSSFCEALDRLLIIFFLCLALSPKFEASFLSSIGGATDNEAIPYSDEKMPLSLKDDNAAYIPLLDLIVSTQLELRSQGRLSTFFNLLDEKNTDLFRQIMVPAAPSPHSNNNSNMYITRSTSSTFDPMMYNIVQSPLFYNRNEDTTSVTSSEKPVKDATSFVV